MFDIDIRYRYSISIFDIDIRYRYSISIFDIDIRYRYSISIFDIDIRYRYSISIFDIDIRYRYSIFEIDIRYRYSNRFFPTLDLSTAACTVLARIVFTAAVVVRRAPLIVLRIGILGTKFFVPDNSAYSTGLLVSN